MSDHVFKSKEEFLILLLKYVLAILHSTCNSQPEIGVKLICKILFFNTTLVLPHNTLFLPWSPALGEKINFTDLENLTG